MKRTIGVITVARSDYGLYAPILKKIIAHPNLRLRLYVSGAHFSSKFGSTIREIEKDGFPIAAKVQVASTGDSPADIAVSMGQHTAGFAKVFKKEQPDIVLVLGDRFEMHAAGLAAIPFRIPLAHIHGGELTYGAIDEYFRHSLTKLSSVHFAATKIYARHIIQMGEDPRRVIVSGAPGVDDAVHTPKFSKHELSKRYGINFSQPVLLVNFHPVTTEYEYTKEYIVNLLRALSYFSNYNVVFTYPNADAGREIIIKKIEAYARDHTNVVIVKNFGHQGHLSMMAHTTAMIGNSSSGIIEAASFKLPVVNIGTRQEGRVRSKNVIDVAYESSNIAMGIRKATASNFRASLSNLVNLYGDGNASERIVAKLSSIALDGLVVKKFYPYPPYRK
ncbi:MAG: UDP-N-acetylglucosamine 2-epimerase [bacterium]|nr:UDP-N-acetylglucosamine 2-epimerase [bacterium]